MAEVCAKHKNDKGHQIVNYDRLKRGTAKIPRPTGTRDKRYIPMGDWTMCTNRNDKNGERIGAQCPTVIQTDTSFRLHCTSEVNLQHSRADFFDLKREAKETAADIWKKTLDVEKNCEFETITAAELIALKFPSLIGKSTRDYELKKFEKAMSVEAITRRITRIYVRKTKRIIRNRRGKETPIRGKRKLKIAKNKPNVTRKQDNWTAINVELPIGPNSMNVPQRKEMHKMR